MTSMTTVEIEGAASAQLVRPDVAQTEWLAFPFTALAWGMTHDTAIQSGLQPVRLLEDPSPAAIGFVEG